MNRILSLLLVLLSLPALAASSHFSAEIPLGALDHGPAFNTQDNPHAAAGPNGFFAVWYDGRKGNTIFGAHLAPDGRVLEPTGIEIGPGYATDVVADGEDYLVARAFDCSHVELTRILPSGQTAPFGALLGQGTACIGDLSMAVAGDRLLLAWQEGDAVRSTVIRIGDHSVVASGFVPLFQSVIDLDTATDGRDFVIAALGIIPTNARQPETVRVSSDGTIGERLILGTVNDVNGIAIAWNGSTYTVLWTGVGSFGQLVTAANAISGPRLGFVETNTRTAAPVLEGYGAGTLVTYSITLPNGSTTMKVIGRIDPLGGFVETDRFPVVANGGNQLPARLAFDGRQFFVVWGEQGDVFGAMIDSATARRRDPKVLTESAHEQVMPAIAADDAGGALAVWNEYRDGWIIRGQIVGGALVPTIASGDFSTKPAVVFDGANYDVFWNTGTQILLRRIGRDGTILDRDPIEIGQATFLSSTLAAVAGGGSVLVAWPTIGELGGTISGTLVTGGVPSPEIVISKPDERPLDKGLPAAAWDGTQFFVAWEQSPIVNILISPIPPQKIELRGARVTKDGAVLDPGGIEIAPARLFRGPAAVASNGREFLAVWTDAIGPNNTKREVRGARILANGIVAETDLTLGSVADNSVAGLALAFDGVSYALAWGSGPDYLFERIGADARTVLARSAVVNLGAIALAPLSTRELAVIYTRQADEPAFGSVVRVFARTTVPGGRRRGLS